LYEALAKAFSRSGRFAIVATTDDKPKADRLAAESLLKRGFDGLILSTAREDDDFPTRGCGHPSGGPGNREYRVLPARPESHRLPALSKESVH
ncbi:hypothetical protein AB9F41_34195, partial [Rhizobium leguminosarum]